MFNKETKNLFLIGLTTDTLRQTYASIFNRTEDFEQQLNKDILDFSIKECMELLASLNPKSVGHIGVLKSQLNKYAEWGIENNTTTAKNNWAIIGIDENIAKFSFRTRYVKDIQELIHVVDTGISAIYDKYLLYLLYMGIMGENCEEISLLKDSDVDKMQGTITTIRRKYNKIIEPLHELIIKDEYFEERRQRDKESPYFIKPFKSKKLHGKPVGIQYFYRAFLKLNNNYFNETNDKKFFTPTTIWRSGLYYSLYRIEQVKNSLVNHDYFEVCEVYGKESRGIVDLSKEYDLYKEVFWQD